VDDAARGTRIGGRVDAMSTEPASRPVIRTQAELERLWESAVPAPTDGEHRLWLLRIDPDRRAVPRIVEISGTVDPPEPHDEMTAGLVALLRCFVEDEPAASIAALRSRPGRGVRREDREWAHLLHAAAARADVRMEVVHLMTDAGVLPLPLDEIGVRTSA
jgi:hypothetical protein